MAPIATNLLFKYFHRLAGASFIVFTVVEGSLTDYIFVCLKWISRLRNFDLV